MPNIFLGSWSWMADFYTFKCTTSTSLKGGGIWHQHLNAQIKTNFGKGASLRTRRLQKSPKNFLELFGIFEILWSWGVPCTKNSFDLCTHVLVPDASSMKWFSRWSLRCRNLPAHNLSFTEKHLAYGPELQGTSIVLLHLKII